MTVAASAPLLNDAALESLRLAGNPFRNFFARNPDDDVCARFHVAELFAKERGQLLGVVDLYRAEPGMHSEMVPILGNKGAGKTHLLHSIKHGGPTPLSKGAKGVEEGWQLLVTPGTYQKDTDFLEYLLFQLIDTLLGGGKQKGRRPLEYLSEQLTRSLLQRALTGAGRDEQMALFPAPGLGRIGRFLGLGSAQAQERTQWLLDHLRRPQSATQATPLRRLCVECALDPERACQLLCNCVDRSEPHDAAGLLRRHIYQGFARAALLDDESDLANFLTYGFAELDFKVKPSRQDLVLSLCKVLMGVFQTMKIPVVVAFDQLEDLLLARRNDDGRRTAEAFFAGIVQTMHQIDGVCFLVFAERGLWNRFVPSLDGYIQDRLNNPVHVPGLGTIKTLKLEAPPPELFRRVVEARLASVVQSGMFAPLFPFTEEQIEQIARTEPTLRDMLQQCRHLFDHLVYGEVQKTAYEETEAQPRNAFAPAVKSFVVVETPTEGTNLDAVQVKELVRPAAGSQVTEAWEHALTAARETLAPEGALTGATRELQSGLGAFLQTCHEHGVKVGPWRLQHVVPEWSFGGHPTYGVITIAHWVCRDGQPWKVGIGLFLGRGAGKPKDLEIKLSSLDATPTMIDHLILLRPDDDLALSGKSKTIWQDAEKRGRHARLEPSGADHFAMLYAFPRWLSALGESLPPGQPLPNLADIIQERCEKLLEQVCMPVP
ncbi:MAG: hypothetical protein L0Y72_03565 [Gemmataceae bacterium]|nr:hypothetical protein [Gemmataceae bacterium]MCI0738096.1 hypothetical protein [Gemmataceae bacterium]